MFKRILLACVATAFFAPMAVAGVVTEVLETPGVV